MRYLSLIFAVIGLPVWAQSLTQGERDYAMSELHATRKQFLDAVAGLSEAQWTFRPAPGRPSIAEIAGRVLAGEQAELAQVRRVLKNPATPAPPPKDPDDHAAAEQVYARAAAGHVPVASGRPKPPATPGAAAAAFRKLRNQTIRYVETTGDDLRDHAANGLNAYQMIVALAGATERQVAGIEQVTSDPHFPK